MKLIHKFANTLNHHFNNDVKDFFFAHLAIIIFIEKITTIDSLIDLFTKERLKFYKKKLINLKT